MSDYSSDEEVFFGPVTDKELRIRAEKGIDNLDKTVVFSPKLSTSLTEECYDGEYDSNGEEQDSLSNSVKLSAQHCNTKADVLHTNVVSNSIGRTEFNNLKRDECIAVEIFPKAKANYPITNDLRPNNQMKWNKVLQAEDMNNSISSELKATLNNLKQKELENEVLNCLTNCNSLSKAELSDFKCQKESLCVQADVEQLQQNEEACFEASLNCFAHDKPKRRLSESLEDKSFPDEVVKSFVSDTMKLPDFASQNYPGQISVSNIATACVMNKFEAELNDFEVVKTPQEDRVFQEKRNITLTTVTSPLDFETVVLQPKHDEILELEEDACYAETSEFKTDHHDPLQMQQDEVLLGKGAPVSPVTCMLEPELSESVHLTEQIGSSPTRSVGSVASSELKANFNESKDGIHTEEIEDMSSECVKQCKKSSFEKGLNTSKSPEQPEMDSMLSSASNSNEYVLELCGSEDTHNEEIEEFEHFTVNRFQKCLYNDLQEQFNDLGPKQIQYEVGVEQSNFISNESNADAIITDYKQVGKLAVVTDKAVLCCCNDSNLEEELGDLKFLMPTEENKSLLIAINADECSQCSEMKHDNEGEPETLVNDVSRNLCINFHQEKLLKSHSLQQDVLMCKSDLYYPVACERKSGVNSKHEQLKNIEMSPFESNLTYFIDNDSSVQTDELKMEMELQKGHILTNEVPLNSYKCDGEGQVDKLKSHENIDLFSVEEFKNNSSNGSFELELDDLNEKGKSELIEMTPTNASNFSEADDLKKCLDISSVAVAKSELLPAEVPFSLLISDAAKQVNLTPKKEENMMSEKDATCFINEFGVEINGFEVEKELHESKIFQSKVTISSAAVIPPLDSQTVVLEPGQGEVPKVGEDACFAETRDFIIDQDPLQLQKGVLSCKATSPFTYNTETQCETESMQFTEKTSSSLKRSVGYSTSTENKLKTKLSETEDGIHVENIEKSSECVQQCINANKEEELCTLKQEKLKMDSILTSGKSVNNHNFKEVLELCGSEDYTYMQINNLESFCAKEARNNNDLREKFRYLEWKEIGKDEVNARGQSYFIPKEFKSDTVGKASKQEETLQVTPNQEVLPCCYDSNSGIKLGDLEIVKPVVNKTDLSTVLDLNFSIINEGMEKLGEMKYSSYQDHLETTSFKEVSENVEELDSVVQLEQGAMTAHEKAGNCSISKEFVPELKHQEQLKDAGSGYLGEELSLTRTVKSLQIELLPFTETSSSCVRKKKLLLSKEEPRENQQLTIESINFHEEKQKVLKLEGQWEDGVISMSGTDAACLVNEFGAEFNDFEVVKEHQEVKIFQEEEIINSSTMTSLESATFVLEPEHDKILEVEEDACYVETSEFKTGHCDPLQLKYGEVLQDKEASVSPVTCIFKPELSETESIHLSERIESSPKRSVSSVASSELKTKLNESKDGNHVEEVEDLASECVKQCIKSGLEKETNTSKQQEQLEMDSMLPSASNCNEFTLELHGPEDIYNEEIDEFGSFSLKKFRKSLHNNDLEERFNDLGPKQIQDERAGGQSNFISNELQTVREYKHTAKPASLIFEREENVMSQTNAICFINESGAEINDFEVEKELHGSKIFHSKVTINSDTVILPPPDSETVVSESGKGQVLEFGKDACYAETCDFETERDPLQLQKDEVLECKTASPITYNLEAEFRETGSSQLAVEFGSSSPRTVDCVISNKLTTELSDSEDKSQVEESEKLPSEFGNYSLCNDYRNQSELNPMLEHAHYHDLMHDSLLGANILENAPFVKCPGYACSHFPENKCRKYRHSIFGSQKTMNNKAGGVAFNDKQNGIFDKDVKSIFNGGNDVHLSNRILGNSTTDLQSNLSPTVSLTCNKEIFDDKLKETKVNKKIAAHNIEQASHSITSPVTSLSSNGDEPPSLCPKEITATITSLRSSPISPYEEIKLLTPNFKEIQPKAYTQSFGKSKLVISKSAEPQRTCSRQGMLDSAVSKIPTFQQKGISHSYKKVKPNNTSADKTCSGELLFKKQLPMKENLLLKEKDGPHTFHMPMSPSLFPKVPKKLKTPKKYMHVQSPVGKYIQDIPVSPLIQIVKAHSKITSASKSGKSKVEKYSHSMKVKENEVCYSALPPAKYCSKQTSKVLSPQVSKPVLKVHNSPMITKHIGPKHIISGPHYLENESFLNASYQLQNFTSDMDATVVEQVNVCYSNTIANVKPS